MFFLCNEKVFYCLLYCILHFIWLIYRAGVNFSPFQIFGLIFYSRNHKREKEERMLKNKLKQASPGRIESLHLLIQEAWLLQIPLQVLLEGMLP